MFKKLLLLLLLLIFYKFLTNYICYQKCKKFRILFIEWTLNSTNNFEEYRSEIISLFKKANISDEYIPITQPTGYGCTSTQNASVFSNFPSKHEKIAPIILKMLDDTVGIYRERYKEALNPLYWIDVIIFLPKNLITYIGLSLETPAFKLCNILASAIWWILLFLLYLFGNDLYQYIFEFISQFQQKIANINYFF